TDHFQGYFQRLSRIKAIESSRLMERAMGIEPTSEAWEPRNKKLETLDLAALSRSGPTPKDEPSKTRLYRNSRRRRPRGTRLTTGEGAVSEAGPVRWINAGAYV